MMWQWQPGDQIVLRHCKQGWPAWVIPVTVVEDTPATIALYVAMDTPLKRPVDLDGTPIPRTLRYAERAAIPWRLGVGRWRGNSVLWLYSPDSAYAVGVFWAGVERTFAGWYANLQEPLRRTRVGFDTADQLLDITVSPDRTWHWKDDDDEFAEAAALSRFTSAEATQIRAQGEAVIPLIEQGVWPFQPVWETWQPEPSWDIPGFPANWEER